MFSNMSFSTSLFLLLLFFTQGIPSIDGRPLNSGKISNQPQPNDMTTKIIAGNFNRDMQVERSNGESFANAPPGDGVIGASQVMPPPPPVHDTSDFRPPVNDISNQPQPNDTTTKIIAGNFNRDMQVERSNGESFANAPPGDGVIGASQVVPPPPPVHDTSDFRPTAPGHSPGVGHSVHN